MDPKSTARATHPGLLGALFAIMICLLAAPVEAAEAASDGALWDAQRYIDIDEVKPGMEAYCLTDYGEGGIEKFALKVLDVIHGFETGRDAILVMGLDERFKHTGPVGGCSGSPVYIDGRLAGALAFGWSYAKDPLYGVTPIREMLQVGRGGTASPSTPVSQMPAFTFDFSRPLDLAEIDKQFTEMKLAGPLTSGKATALPCPVLISGVPSEVFQQAASQLEAMGFAALPGLSGDARTESDGAETPALQPGGSLAVPLVAGDIKMNVLGTVTEVRGDRVYAFGHSFLGYGPVNLPMAGGKVYTVISNVMRSFKLGTATDIVGALTFDESAAVSGRIGAKAPMIPLSIRVERYNDSEPRSYHCQVAYNDLLTAGLVRTAIAGAALQRGSLPPDHTVEYKSTVNLDDGQAIRFSNVSTGADLAEPVSEVVGTVALIMNNPYESAKVESIDFEVRITPKNIAAHLWSVETVTPTVKPGEDIEVDVVLESFLVEKKKYRVKVPVPDDIAPGKYGLMLCGVYEYERFLRKAVPYRFIATNYQALVDALNGAMNVNRTQLYCLLVLPPGGITLDRAELPDLPGTKAMVLQSDRRALRVQPYPHWVEKTVETGTVIADKEIIPIIVEK